MQSVIMEETGTVEAIERSLESKIGSKKYRIWFKNSTKFALGERCLRVSVPNLFIADWIEKHFSDEINQSVRAIVSSDLKVMFSVDPALSEKRGKSQLMSHPGLSCKTENSISQRPATKNAANAGTLKFHLDTFVVGPSNQLAHNAAVAVAREKKSPFNPLFIHGGYGVGKTHLMQGICNEVRNIRLGTNWLYLSAEEFANQFVLALKTRRLEAFRSRLRQMDLLAIDDIHFLASKSATQQEFLHTFNSIDLAGKQIILVSDAHPKMIEQLSEKLVNRFVSGMVVKIESPDFQMRCQICKQFAASMCKHLPESVIKYISENIHSNIRELEGAVLKLVAYASLANRKINLFMAEEILVEHLSRTDPMVHISDIEASVASYFDVNLTEMHSPKKSKTISMARHFSMYLARKHTNMSFSEIGRCMGNKNHATVLLACRKIETELEKNAQINWKTRAGNKVSKSRTVLAHLQESISK